MLSRSHSPEFSPLSIGKDLTPLPTYKAASTTSIDFSNLLEPLLQLHEDLKSGCGGQLWPAGMVLAKQILRYHRNPLKDARMYVNPFSPHPTVAEKQIVLN
jgi:protein N-lysine methyltransferase METTL21A